MERNREEAQHIHVMNFSEDANNIVNKAIKYAIDEKCGYISLVHVFLALLEKTAVGKNILDKLDLSFDMIYESYQILAEKGTWGTLNNDTIEQMYEMDAVSKPLFITLAHITTQSAFRRKIVEPEDILDILIEMDNEELEDFLEYINLDIDQIKDIKNEEFYIPDELEDFVTDMNTDTKRNEEKILNIDKHVDKLIEVLSRKLEANPCLVGPSGVGKTSIVYGLVQRIISGNVPNEFKDKHIIYINSSLLTAGTRFRGDFEERMMCLMNWASNKNIILFLDEMHTFVSLGGGAETAGNMIKKALSDGDIRIIGATTTAEYHKFIEKDSAFDRRLQVIEIKEPSVEDTIALIKDTKDNYEKFHKVRINPECIDLLVRLADRYIKDKAFPAKAYKIIDQAATYCKLIKKEVVEKEDVLKVVSDITGMNVNRLSKNEAKQLINLENTLSKQLIGQENAVKTVCKAIRRSKAGVREENKPLASFMFVGPTGVGKTELCKVLSQEVAVGDVSFIKIDMSEFSEKYSTSKLIGSAPGYVGYGEGGRLTEKVKHNPFSLVLFDEIEKADKEIYNIFLQLLDEGRLTDGEGNTVDFTNCIIVMTSNAGYGADKLNKGKIGFALDDNANNSDDAEKIAMEALKETFRPEFLNRLDNIVVFNELDTNACKKIVKLLLDKLATRVYNNNKVTLTFGKTLIDHISTIGYSKEYGARNIKREIQNNVEDILSDYILNEELREGDSALLSWKNNKVTITKAANKVDLLNRSISEIEA